ncbi:DrmB family protein [Bradyrhizobium liaoningense]
MSKNTQRLSQVISTFGPGAMVDLPTRSVVIGGLEQWDMKGGGFTTLSEPRLQERLEKLLKDRNRLDQSKSLSLRTPPITEAAPNGEPRGISSAIFPAWFVCEDVDVVGTGPAGFRRRRLVRWKDLDATGRKRFNFDDGRKSEVTPIRFVCACTKGHLQDIDWRWVVHGTTVCQEPMWVEEKGTSADPADTSVVCGCGRRLSLQEAFIPGRLGKCRGERPWLLDKDPDGCDLNLKLLTRTATNTYFPQVLTIISLPSEEDELTKLVADLSGELTNVKSVEHVAGAKLFNPKVAASLGEFADQDIFDRLVRIREGAKADASKSPKVAEFDVFASGRDEIGQNYPAAKLYAQTLKREAWASAPDIDLSSVKSLVAVHRLREVSCLYGFTRFEAAPTSSDGDIEDVSLAVDGAPISRDADWLPAIEQFGEGLFVHFDEAKIRAWMNGEPAKERDSKLIAGFQHWSLRFGGKGPKYPGLPYALLHSLSHALMSEIALDCGYPASALKERIYALPEGDGGRFGILIYTATAGAQGTLGGLVATAPRFATILKAALERVAICSNDPVCSDHEPDTQSGDRATHGAACHSCLLIAETSCESRNLYLDRALLTATMSAAGEAFF